MKVAIIKYNAGNIRSVAYALERIGVEPVITDDFDYIRTADKVIFPGVGEAGSTMRYLRTKSLDKLICSLKQPVLGICLGQQLMCSHSEEGDTSCLGIFNVPVKKFPALDKVPHMGWNSIYDLDSEIFTDIPALSFVYFIHSYYVPVCEFSAAACNYITGFSAALHRGNFYATQFHPEKSGDTGQKILKNFIELT